MWIIVDLLGWMVLFGLLAAAAWAGWRLYNETQPRGFTPTDQSASQSSDSEWSSAAEQPTYQ